MADWYEYAVTTRVGPGSVERPEGEGWELVGSTSTPAPSPDRNGPLGSLASAPRAEHHAWWKRKKRQEHAPLGGGKIEVTEERGGRVERRTL